MRVRDVNPFEHCFTHVDNVTGKYTTWASERLAEWCKANNWEVVIVPVEDHHAAFCYKERGVEGHRLRRLFENPDRLQNPILFVTMPEGSQLLLDGTHRYVAAFVLQVESGYTAYLEIPAYVVPYEIAKPFIVEDAGSLDQEQLTKGYSGL
jgi:hypothetical protein